MLALKLKKAQLAWLKEHAEHFSRNNDKIAESILEDIDKAESRVRLQRGRLRVGAMGVPSAVAIIKEVLGARAVLPPNYPNCGGGWYAQLGKRLSDFQVTASDVHKAAVIASRQWKGDIRVESVIRQMDVLLRPAAETGMPGVFDSTPSNTMEEL